MKTVFRIHSPEDIDALVQFWNENSGWDIIDRAEWERRFYDTPFGNSSVVLAEDKLSKDIQAQMIFIPTLVTIEGESRSGRRPFAMLLKKNLHSMRGYLKTVEFTLKMYNHAIKHFQGLGVSFIHMMPDPRWARVFKFFPGLQIGFFPLWSIPLHSGDQYKINIEYSTKIVSASDERIDSLWSKSKMLLGCSVVRNSNSLPWKTSHGSFLLLGVFKLKELIGLIVSIPKLKDKQWLICDILIADINESLTVTIQAACNQAMDFCLTPAGEVLNKVAILATPIIEKVIYPLGFRKENYQFPMLVQLLDPTLSKSQVAPEKWYVSAND